MFSSCHGQVRATRGSVNLVLEAGYLHTRYQVYTTTGETDTAATKGAKARAEMVVPGLGIFVCIFRPVSAAIMVLPRTPAAYSTPREQRVKPSYLSYCISTAVL